MIKKALNQPTTFPTPQVQLFGGASIYEYGLAINDTHTPSNHTFRCLPSPWPMQNGTTTWFGCALPDGNFASGSMTFPIDEVAPTMYQTSLFVWNVSSKAMQCIPVPTTNGTFNPPNVPANFTVWSSTTSYSVNNVVLFSSAFYICIAANSNEQPPNSTYWAPVTSGGAIDTVRSMTINGTNYIFAVGAFLYTNWPIAATSYQGNTVVPCGQPYFIMGFVETNGTWAFDPTHSYTAQQLYNSSSAGQSAFPPSTNTFGEQYWPSNGPVPLVVGPQSKHLIVGTYFYQSGHNSGALIAIDPTTGTVKAFYQLPDCTDNSSTNLSVSVRDITINPTSSNGDERFIVTPDIFIRGGGGNWGYSGLMEFSYNSINGTFTLKSPPVTPYNVPGIGYNYAYNLSQYDSQGNLWLPTHGGTGLGVFGSHEMHVYQASGGNLSTFEDGGPAVNWNTTQFPTILKGDFRFASYSSSGFDQSIDWDNTNGRMIVTGINGNCAAAKPDSSMALGSNKVTNPYFLTGTSGWGGFFTSTLSQTTNSAFILGSANPTGTALLLTGSSGGSNIATTNKLSVIPNRNYFISAYFMGTTAGRSCNIELWFQDENGTQINELVSNSITDNTTSATYLEFLTTAPANAVTAFVLLDIGNGVAHETHMISNVFWQEMPATASTTVSLNKARVTNGANAQNNKGAIINGRLYTTLLTSSTSATPPYGQLPQWLYSIDVNAFD